MDVGRYKSTGEPFQYPSELSREEFADLLRQIRDDFTEEECQQELMEASRYNDVDVARGILAIYPALSSFQEDSTGNTALHMASANGNAEIVDLILRKAPASAVMAANASGNTPLHWGAANGRTSVVSKLIVIDGVDVLVKNKAGRSALTEGFSSNNEEVVRLLLQHESADEDKLVTTKSEGRDTSITHNFQFSSTCIQVRELAIPDGESGSIIGQENSNQDTTGYAIWAGSLVLAHWLSAQPSEIFENKVVLELGSGCGVPGLAVAKAAKGSRIYLTDWNEVALSNLSHNIELNRLSKSASAHSMDWQAEESWPVKQTDILIGSDLVYQDSMVDHLLATIQSLHPTRFFYVAGTRRQGHSRFIAKMRENYNLNEVEAPSSYLQNPLPDQDEESCFVHFNELSTMEFRLYDFQPRMEKESSDSNLLSRGPAR